MELDKILDVNPLTIGSWENHHKKLLPRMVKKIIDCLGYVPPLAVDENTFGGQLYIYRSINGFTQEDILEKLKIDRSAICKVERNENVIFYYYKNIKKLIEN